MKDDHRYNPTINFEKVQYKIPCGCKLQCINSLYCPGERETIPEFSSKMVMCDNSTLILVVLFPLLCMHCVSEVIIERLYDFIC